MLDYPSKQSEETILKIAEKLANKWKPIMLENKLLIGDNFEWLSRLMLTYRSKIDFIYIDPPFNTKRDFYVSNERSNTVSSENSGVIAYSDTLTKEKYLEFMRERLILLRELLSDRGSIYLHIDLKMGHYLKVIMDEIFGEENFKNDLTRIKSNPKNFYRKAYGNEKDMVLFYSKNKKRNIWNEIRMPLEKEEIMIRFGKVDKKGNRYTTIPLHAPGETKNGKTGQMWRGMLPPKGRHWRTNPEDFDVMDSQGLIEWSNNGNPRIIKYAKDHKGKKVQDIIRYKDPQNPIYPTQKNIDMLELFIMVSSDPDSICLDCFAGGGTTLMAARSLGRSWIGIDNSEISCDKISKRMKLEKKDIIML